MNKTKRISILGYGEVGKAIERIYIKNGFNPQIKDLTIYNKFSARCILNICIPFNDDFFKIVENQIQESAPGLVIIHSTVPIGTTRLISDLFPHIPIAHSPIRGDHPKLVKSILTFVKYVGSTNCKHAKKIKKHLKKLGMIAKSLSSPEATEALKLVCTTYYGLCITWYDFLNDLCVKHDIPLKEVKKWQTSYNNGYKKLKRKNLMRPILVPPTNKKIGGHCIIPNATILNNQYHHPLVDHVTKYQ